MTFICEYCNYETDHKSSFDKHILKCDNNNINQPQNLQPGVNKEENEAIDDNLDVQNEQTNSNEIICNYCHHSFPNKSNLITHLYEHCKEKSKIDIKKQKEIKLLKDKLETMEKMEKTNHYLINSLKKENNKLTERNNTLTEENTTLTEENNRLTEDIEYFKDIVKHTFKSKNKLPDTINYVINNCAPPFMCSDDHLQLNDN